MKKAPCKTRASAYGFSMTELLVVLGLIAVMTAISLPYFYNYNRLYKSEQQAIKMVDLMREASQLAITRRRTMRVELDLTQNAFLIIDENGAAPDTRVKTIPLENVGNLRIDTIPAGVTRPNPPNYTDITFAADTIGHQFNGTTVTGNNVWAARFMSDGSVVNAAGVPLNATIYVWPPVTPGSATPRNVKEVRAITLFGGSGALRFWRHNGTALTPSQ